MSLKNGSSLSWPTFTHWPNILNFSKSIANDNYYLDAFPSSAAFDAINAALQSDAAERKDAVSKAKAIVSFNLKNAKGEEDSWYLDLKNEGVVGKGAAPQGAKADG